MIEKDPFTQINDFDDKDQCDEMTNDEIAELQEKLGYMSADEMAEKLDQLSDGDDGREQDLDCDKDLPPISEYFKNEVLKPEERVGSSEERRAASAGTLASGSGKSNIKKVMAGVAAGQMLAAMGQPGHDYMNLVPAMRNINLGQPMRPPKRRRGKKRGR